MLLYFSKASRANSNYKIAVRQPPNDNLVATMPRGKALSPRIMRYCEEGGLVISVREGLEAGVSNKLM